MAETRWNALNEDWTPNELFHMSSQLAVRWCLSCIDSNCSSLLHWFFRMNARCCHFSGESFVPRVSLRCWIYYTIIAVKCNLCDWRDALFLLQNAYIITQKNACYNVFKWFIELRNTCKT